MWPLVSFYSARACLRSGLLAPVMELVESNEAVATSQAVWFTSLGSTQVTSAKEATPAHLASHPYPSWNMVPSQHFPLVVLAIPRIENTSTRLRDKRECFPLTLTPNPFQALLSKVWHTSENPDGEAQQKIKMMCQALDTWNSSELHWKWYLTRFQSMTFLHKTRYDYGATCPSSNAFLCCPASSSMTQSAALPLNCVLLLFSIFFNVSFKLEFILYLMFIRGRQKIMVMESVWVEISASPLPNG